MKRWPVLLAAGVAASASALVLAVGGSAQGPSPKTFQLVERPVQLTEIHNPPRRVAQGDAAVYRAKLTASGETIGSEHSHCVVTKADKHPVALCTDSFFLRDGRITAVGGVNLDRSEQLLPVVGGTGAYEGAQGTVLFEIGKRAVLTFNVKP